MKKLSLILSFSALTLGLFAVMSCNSSNSQGQQDAKDQPAETQQTTLFKAVAAENEVFPSNCDTMGIAWGDLNLDGLKDVVVVATPRHPEKMQTRDDGYEYNFNSPVMGIYFGTKDGKLSLFKEYENTIPGTEDEFCFTELEVLFGRLHEHHFQQIRVQVPGRRLLSHRIRHRIVVALFGRKRDSEHQLSHA